MSESMSVIGILRQLTYSLRFADHQLKSHPVNTVYPLDWSRALMTRIALPFLLILFGLGGDAALGQPVHVSFDFSQSEIGIEATVNGEPVFILLDTGVDPSAIDLHRAEALHLKIRPQRRRRGVWLRQYRAAHSVPHHHPGLRDLRAQIREL